MNIHSTIYPYASQRNAVYGTNGMVATSQPLAAQAGIRILQQGGNAVDAAIATAAALTVVEPTANGIGGDAFALVWMKDKLYGLNASGRSPASINVESLKKQGLTEMPTYGWIPVTVPGTPSAWATLNKRWGKLSLIDCLAPAIEYAEQGYPVSPTLVEYWKKGFEKFVKLRLESGGDVYQAWLDTFAPSGRPPKLGEIWSSKGHAKTLKLIGETQGESFYHGEIAAKIVQASKKAGGYLRAEDLEAHAPEWIEPIKINYRGYDVWEIPPNGQGIIALMALNIMQQFKPEKHNDADNIHIQIEAMKLAFADGLHYITDANAMDVDPKTLLSSAYAKKRATLITEHAELHCHGNPKSSGTVYLATADYEGNMVSFIQSNFMGFGSGIVVPTTGIALQNRGCTFSFNKKHANYLQPNKRTYHTIIPGFISYQGQAVGPFGVMGGFMQPQGHMQVVMNLIDYQLNPQAALDAPRWQWIKEDQISVEKSMPSHIIRSLLEKGHKISVSPDSSGFGRGQAILREPGSGVLVGGTEARTDGAVIVY